MSHVQIDASIAAGRTIAKVRATVLLATGCSRTSTCSKDAARRRSRPYSRCKRRLSLEVPPAGHWGAGRQDNA